MKKKSLIPILHIHLTDHCNLNCRGCDNFSPLSPEIFADINIIERDFARISELSNKKVSEIQLLGGEPLLHPDINAFTDIARKYFPTVPIKIVTNGLLLQKQPDSFWQHCKNNNIEIVVTKYPINIDHDFIEQYVIERNVAFSYYGNTKNIPKTMMCMPLDLKGQQNPQDSFLRCNSANRCIALDNGKIYTCAIIPYVKYFNSYFKCNLEVSESDYLDIFKVNNIDDILTFIARPMPFCRYCNKKGAIWNIGYGRSKKDITEWIGSSNKTVKK